VRDEQLLSGDGATERRGARALPEAADAAATRAPPYGYHPANLPAQRPSERSARQVSAVFCFNKRTFKLWFADWVDKMFHLNLTG